MKQLGQVCAALRRKNRVHSALLAGCCFFSVLLITAYGIMMRSPTILAVLPEGGDSRKQVLMIFVMAVIGCAMFTVYASGLFFRHRSRQTGILLALGASRRQLRRQLNRELAVLAAVSCAAGAVLAAPLAWGIWQLFRLFVVDSAQMTLRFEPRAWAIALGFSVFVAVLLFAAGGRSVRRANIIETVQEVHRSEPIRAVPRWYGPLGIFLLAAGGLLGYLAPSVFVNLLHWYPPAGLSGLFYLPALAGLYMILLHTVVNGWRARHAYRDLIATSMMKFQGRQTVRSMLVMTLLIGGGLFAAFYTPMIGAGSMLSYDARPVDYAYHFRADQNGPEKTQVEQLADEYSVALTSWAEAPMARLAVDGSYQVEEEGPLGTTWRSVYAQQAQSVLVLSESGYRALTGEIVDLAPGQAAGVLDASGSGQGRFEPDATLFTNPLTGQQLAVTPAEPLCHDLLLGCYVLDDGDWTALSDGLTGEWLEQMVFFNLENEEDSYPFARALFDRIVDGSGPEVAVLDGWDPIVRQRYLEEEGVYFLDPDQAEEANFPRMDYSQRDSSDFRLYWQYMPRFRVLDKADFVRTTAVFLMLFVFIGVLCLSAVIVIACTRCMTIALTSRPVYNDLRRLGAPGHYLYRSARSQVRRVFLTPALAGSGLILGFYLLILYCNDNRLTAGELAGLGLCLGLTAGVGALLWAVYRLTLGRVCAALDIRR